MTILGDYLSDYAGDPQDLSDEQIESLYERLKHRRLYGDMNRADFAVAVFTKPFDEWPIGHLRDHRVAVPERLAQQCLTFDEAELAQLLGRFLSASTREHAREMIAEGLGVSPLNDARVLINIRESSTAIFTALIQGRLDDVWSLLAKLPASAKIKWHKVRPAMRLMLLYYGSLDLQLVAAWQRAFVRVYSDLSLDPHDSELTVGGFFGHLDDMIKGVAYAALTAQGGRPRGATPNIFGELETEGLALLAYFGIAINDPVLPVLIDTLVRKVKRFEEEGATTAVGTWRASARVAATERASIIGSTTQSRAHPDGPRANLSTLFEDSTGAERIGFASLRLEALVDQDFNLLPKKGAGLRQFRHWNEARFREGADGPSLKFYFVSQAVVVEDIRTCLPNLSLREAFATWGNRDFGGKASSELKKIRVRQSDYTNGRTPVADAIELADTAGLAETAELADKTEITGSAAFDILPEFRLGIMRTLVSGKGNRKSAKRTDGPPKFYKDHGIYK